MVTIPLPDQIPFVVAALPISSDLKVAQLYELHQQVVFGLLNVDAKLLSYGCDGTQNERDIQHIFTEDAPHYFKHVIENPRKGGKPMEIKVPGYLSKDGEINYIVMVQDSKHAAKTLRNNLFSGARLLVLGNHVALFRHIFEMAFEEGSPLYHRDVQNLDHQDDNAAAWLGTAETLQFLSDNHADRLGTIIFLFALMEVLDAYQNRHIQRSK